LRKGKPLNAYAEQLKKNKSQAAAYVTAQKKSKAESINQFIDNRPIATSQRKVQEAANAFTQQQASLQRTDKVDINRHLSLQKNTNTPLQLRLSLNGEYFIRRLGSGTFGSAYETNQGNVAKFNKADDGKAEFEKLQTIYAENPEVVVRPISHGAINKEAGVDPIAFDDQQAHGKEGFLMEKLARLTWKDTLTDRERVDPRGLGPKDLAAKVSTVVKSELQIFFELLKLREDFRTTGYSHNDIKHINVGKDTKGKLKAFDVGISGPIRPEPTKDQVDAVNIARSNDDYFKSYRSTLDLILARLGMNEHQIRTIYQGMEAMPESQFVPGPLLQPISDLRWAKNEGEALLASMNLETETIEWVDQVVEFWSSPGFERAMQFIAPVEQIDTPGTPQRPDISESQHGWLFT
jgi:hypothetical protein